MKSAWVRGGIFVLLLLLAGVTNSHAVAGCGPGTDNTTCGNVGYSGTLNPTSVAKTCGNTLTAGTAGNPKYYHLTGDVTAAGGDANACFNTWDMKYVVFDLNGYTINGRFVLGGNPSGSTIKNGTIKCTWPDSAADAGCLRGNNGSAQILADVTIEYLTVQNLVATFGAGTDNRTIFFDWSTGTNAASYKLIFDHVTVPTVTGGVTRTNAIGTQLGTHLTVEVKNSDITTGDAYAPQGVSCYDNGCDVHDTRITLNNTTQSEGGRAVSCDGGVGNIGTALRCNFYNLDLYLGHSTSGAVRAIRFRNHKPWARDITIHGCTGSCVHGYDSDTPNGNLDYTGSIIERITFDSPTALAAGSPASGGYNDRLMTFRGGHGAIVRDIILTGTTNSPYLAHLDFLGWAGYATDVTFQRSYSFSTPNVSLVTGATATMCDSGTSTGGTVTNVDGTCPPVVVAPSSLAFGDQNTGTTSAPQAATLTNNSFPLNISSAWTNTVPPWTTGTQFAVSSTTCGSTLAAATSCTINYTFAPTADGAKSDTFTIAHDASNSPQTVSVSGIGIATPTAPTASLACTPAFVQLGGTFTCTPTVTNATSCSLLGTYNNGGINHAINQALANCTDPVDPSDYAGGGVGTISAYVRATGAGGTTDSAAVDLYVQQKVAGVSF